METTDLKNSETSNKGNIRGLRKVVSFSFSTKNEENDSKIIFRNLVLDMILGLFFMFFILYF